MQALSTDLAVTVSCPLSCTRPQLCHEHTHWHVSWHAWCESHKGQQDCIVCQQATQTATQTRQCNLWLYSLWERERLRAWKREQTWHVTFTTGLEFFFYRSCSGTAAGMHTHSKCFLCVSTMFSSGLSHLLLKSKNRHNFSVSESIPVCCVAVTNYWPIDSAACFFRLSGQIAPKTQSRAKGLLEMNWRCTGGIIQIHVSQCWL